MLPAIRREFLADTAEAQAMLSVFLLGFAVSQLIYGPLSDRFGRRPLIIVGMTIYGLASLACALANSIEMLVAARFVQALGACAGPVLARAIVRDLYERREAARILAYMASAMALIPAVAPVFGGWLGESFGWRFIFDLIALFALLLLAWSAWHLVETNDRKRPDALNVAVLFSTYLSFFRSRIFLAFTLVNAFTYGAMFAFISGSSFVLIEGVGISPKSYGLCFGAVVVGYIIGAWSAGRLSPRGAGLVMPNSVAGAIAPFPDRAGSASAMLGFVQMAGAAGSGALVGLLHDGSALPMVAVILVCGLLGLLALPFLPEPETEESLAE
jgi:DHA1 family bicyclomycin/chloramphenicol resistance-like MFS transporter